MNKNRDIRIDFTRIIAAFLVLLFHLEIIDFGFLGVDLFFLISGYLVLPKIIGIKDQRHKFLFFTRRIKRIWPAQIFTLTLTCVFAAVILPVGLHYDFWQSVIASILRIQNVLFWVEDDYFAASSKYKLLLHYWSLAVEEQFYLLSFLVALLSARLHFGIFMLFFTISFVLCQLEFGNSEFYLLPFRLWEFILGYMIFRNARVSLVIILLLAALPMLTLDYILLTHLSIAAAFACVMLANRIEVHSKIKILIQSLADRSYSLYLAHWPVIVFCNLYIFDDASLIYMIVIIAIFTETIYTIDRRAITK